MRQRNERSRAANFSKEEESLLLQIINNHIDIIENKRTDEMTKAIKRQEWERVVDEFNSQNLGELRDAGTLKRKYENIKRGIRIKTKLSSGNMVDRKTENGPEEITFSEEETRLLEVIGPQTIDLQNRYEDDDDLAEDNQMLIYDGPTQEPSEDVHIKVESDETEVQAPVQSHVAVTPRSSVPAPKSRRRDRPLARMSAWVKSKTNSAEQEKEFRRELHEQKILHLEEEHKLRKQLLEQQLRHAEEQQSWLREEHLAKMDQIKKSKLS